MDATHARAITDYVGAIQFQSGDVIKIGGKDISPGWYSGSSSNKTGLFPITAVQLGYSDIPDLDSTGCFNPQKKAPKEVLSFIGLLKKLKLIISSLKSQLHIISMPLSQ